MSRSVSDKWWTVDKLRSGYMVVWVDMALSSRGDYVVAEMFRKE